jgi:hypothetical protein
MDKMLALVEMHLMGIVSVTVPELLSIRAALVNKWDLTKPLNLESQLNAADLDADVQEALLLQLVGQTHAPWNRSISAFVMEGPEGSQNLFAVLNVIIAGRGASYSVELLGSTQSNSDDFLVSLRGSTLEGTCVLKDFSCLSPKSALPLPSLESILAEVDEGREGSVTWQFDMFVLAEVCSGHQLSVLTFYLLSRTGLLRKLNLSVSNLLRWV